MDTLLPVATAAIIAVAMLAYIDPAHAADATPKQPDRVTIGDTVRPDPLVGLPRATSLARAPMAPRAATPNLAAIKAESFGTASTTSGPLSAAQRDKLAAATAVTSSIASPGAISGAKPQELSTITPPTAGAPAPPIDDRMRTKNRSLLEAPSVGRTLAGHRNGALGLIPRPEWSATGTATKPEEARTIGTATTSEWVAPTAAELQRRAAPTVAAPGAAKASPVSTSRPRDPSAPPARADKNRPSHRTAQEVRP